MKRSFALVSIAALLAAGCTRPVVKETVVERPVVVERPAAAAAGSTVTGCIYASQAYSHGSVSCQDRSQFKCENGVWQRTFTAC
jgi:hypothetical protein